ncbi:hypothetical protein ACOME3_008188 [Neoechinorhynchus agilis]
MGKKLRMTIVGQNAFCGISDEDSEDSTDNRHRFPESDDSDSSSNSMKKVTKNQISLRLGQYGSMGVNLDEIISEDPPLESPVEDPEPLNSNDDDETSESELTETTKDSRCRNYIIAEVNKLNRSSGWWKFNLTKGIAVCKGQEIIFTQGRGKGFWKQEN